MTDGIDDTTIDIGIDEGAASSSGQGTQSISRAIRILRVVASGRESGVTLRDIVDFTRLTRPTCHRILALMVDEGIVEKKTKTRRYAIGDQISHLALARRTRSPWTRITDEWLDDAAKSIGDAVFITVRSKTDTLCVNRKFGNHSDQALALEVGGRRPIGVSSAGMAILSGLDNADANAILEFNQPRLSSYGMTFDGVMNEVASARTQGYAVRRRGLVPGTTAASVVLDIGDCHSLAALTVAASQGRFTTKHFDETINFLLRSKQHIEASLC